MSTSPPGRSGLGSKVVLVAGSLLLALGILAGLVNREVVDGNRFAGHIDNIRRDPAVSRLVGEAIANQVIAAAPNLVALRPLIEATATSLAASGAFGPVVRATAQQVHHAFTQEDNGRVVLRLADVGAVMAAALSTLAPDSAARIPPSLSVTLAGVGAQSFAARTLRLTRIVGLAAWLLPLLAALLFGLAIWLSVDRLYATIGVGWAVIGSGLGVGFAAIVAAVLAGNADTDTLRGAIVSAGWHELGGIVWRTAAITVLAGSILLAGTTARIPNVDAIALARRLSARAVRPEQRSARIVHSLVVIGFGALCVLRPLTVLGAVTGLAGIVLLVAGVSELALAAGARRRTDFGTPRSRRRCVLAASPVLAAAIGLVLVGSGAAPAHRQISGLGLGGGNGCNGHIELCDRPYNDVAFVAAHNAMSAADEPGWFIPEQETGLVGALQGGVRALLIDTWYGQNTTSPGVVTTAPVNYAAALAEAHATYGQAVIDSLLRVRDTVSAAPVGPVLPFLCHGLCEIGATAWEPVMSQVHAWLEANPREVVTFVIEDNVSPADTAAVFRDSGLLPTVDTQVAGQPWPTLGQMIESGRRVVVLMERRGGGTAYPWLLQGFDWLQDTPYSNPSLDDLSCKLYRGSADNPLFMVNNWLTGFGALVTNARRANTYAQLVPYLERCRAERGQIPNFVAVNFPRQGDVFRAVDHLNGVR